MKEKIIIFTVLLMLLFVNNQKVCSQENAAGPKKMIIIGKVIDVSCYVAGDNNEWENKECVVSYLKVGQPAGILEEGTGRLYIVAKTPEKAANLAAQLIPYAGDKVRVEGIVNTRAGITTIEIQKIENIE